VFIDPRPLGRSLAPKPIHCRLHLRSILTVLPCFQPGTRRGPPSPPLGLAAPHHSSRHCRSKFHRALGTPPSSPLPISTVFTVHEPLCGHPHLLRSSSSLLGSQAMAPRFRAPRSPVPCSSFSPSLGSVLASSSLSGNRLVLRSMATRSQQRARAHSRRAQQHHRDSQRRSGCSTCDA
jgi:hypothetical protein